MLIFTAALLGLGVGSAFTSAPATTGRAAGLGLTALALVLVTLTAALGGSSPADWHLRDWTAELGGWLIWSVVGLVGSATAVFADDLRLGVQGVAIATIATALLLVFADSPAAALAVLASGAALWTLVLAAPRTSDSEVGFNHPLLGAIGAGLLTFVLMMSISSTSNGSNALKAKALAKTGDSEATRTSLADCLLPAIVVVALVILNQSSQRATSNPEPGPKSDQSTAGIAGDAMT